MNIQHLKYAIAVEKTGSISAAAETLYMGQPNLSKAIKELEETLGISIFKRTAKGVLVTSEGKEFLHYARNILIQFEEMESIGRSKKPDVQSFRISVPRSSYITDAFTSFVEDLDLTKAIELDFYETNSMKAIAHVLDGSSHMGIIRYRMDYEPYFRALLIDKELEHQDIWEFEYLLLMANSHPLAGQSKITSQDLLKYIEIMHGDLSVPYYSGGKRESGGSGDNFNKKIYVYERGSQFDLLARISYTYMWVSPMPPDLLKRNGLVQRSCSTGGRYKDALIFSKGHKPDKFEDAFIHKLEKSIAKVSNELE